MTRLSKSTAYRDLVESFGFVSIRLRLASRLGVNIDKEERVEKSEELLQPVRSMKHQFWQYIVTLNEARFD
jgi:hypothetical protein